MSVSKPLCGFLPLFLVPVFYAVFAMDLEGVPWSRPGERSGGDLMSVSIRAIFVRRVQ